VVDQVLELDLERRALLGQVEALKAERNAVSKEIGKMKDPASARPRSSRCAWSATRLPPWTRACARWMKPCSPGFHHPQPPRRNHPIGKDEHENVVLRTIGRAAQFDFTPHCRTGNWAKPGHLEL
jgi:seryl-tRNA synthetase